MIKNSDFNTLLYTILIYIFKLEINAVFGCLWYRIGYGNVLLPNGIFQNNINVIYVFQENIFHVTFAIIIYEELRIPDARISINLGSGNYSFLELHSIYK